MQFEASHGTVTDLWHAHLRGEETSLNPLGLVEAMIGAMQHAAKLELDGGGPEEDYEKVMTWTTTLRKVRRRVFWKSSLRSLLCSLLCSSLRSSLTPF